MMRRYPYASRPDYGFTWPHALIGMGVVVLVAVIAMMLLTANAHAAGWGSFGKYEHKTGRCGAMREVVVSRINDSGPYGLAWNVGARLDVTPAAATALGLRGSKWLCAS